MVSIVHHSGPFEGGLKSFRPSVRETRDKRPLNRESDRSWCHRHTTSIKSFFDRSLWLYGHRGQHTGKVKSSRLDTRGRWVRTRTGAGVIATLLWSFLDRSPWIHGLSGTTLVNCRRCPGSHELRPKKLYHTRSVALAPASVWFPTQRSLVPSFRYTRPRTFQTSLVLMSGFADVVGVFTTAINLIFASWLLLHQILENIYKHLINW